MDSFKYVVNNEILLSTWKPLMFTVLLSLFIIVITIILTKKELGGKENEKN